MNFSLLTADRVTHLKIVAVALVAATVVTVVGLKARVGDPNMAAKAPATEIVKVGKPPVIPAMVLSSADFALRCNASPPGSLQSRAVFFCNVPVRGRPDA